MRLDGPQGLPPNSLPEKVPPASTPETGSSRSGATNEADSEVLSANIDYIRQAIETEDMDAAAVAEARQLLESGQLDTPEVATRAAELIIKLGL